MAMRAGIGAQRTKLDVYESLSVISVLGRLPRACPTSPVQDTQWYQRVSF